MLTHFESWTCETHGDDSLEIHTCDKCFARFEADVDTVTDSAGDSFCPRCVETRSENELNAVWRFAGSAITHPKLREAVQDFLETVELNGLCT